jgi:hypothetical protein
MDGRVPLTEFKVAAGRREPDARNRADLQLKRRDSSKRGSVAVLDGRNDGKFTCD